MARCSTKKRVYRIDKVDDLKSHVSFSFFSKQLQTQPRMPLMLNDLLYFVLVCFTICYRFVTSFLSTCFLRLKFLPSVFIRLVQRMVGIFMFTFFFLLMEDSLVQYTAVIGLFNCLKFVSCFIVFFGFFFFASNIISFGVNIES